MSVAVAGVLNVSSLTTLATGGIYDDLPQGTSFPCVWYEVNERDVRGLGTGALPEVELRVHVFSQYEGMKEAQAIASQAITLLKDQALTVTGWTHCGHVFYDETVAFHNEHIQGVRVREMVAVFRIYVEAA